MRKLLLMILLVYFPIQFIFSNDKNIDVINDKFVSGFWIYNKDLFYNEMKRLDEPKIDLSNNYKRIEMFFSNDGKFISYLDEQITLGEWIVNDSMLLMKPNLQNWSSYHYAINETSLYIYDRDFILAFKKNQLY